MRELTWNDPTVRQALAAVRAKAPFVYGLTNVVAATLNANVLLAVGAAPAIGAAPGWPATFGANAGAMWINAAALMSSGADTLRDAARAAHAHGTPWVLDPVAFGAGAASYDAVVRSLLPFRPTVIRGNASELLALSGVGSGGRGVETLAASDAALDAIAVLAADTGAAVAVSGAVDYVRSGGETVAVPGGDRRLTLVTGAGCSLGALVAAMLAASDDVLLATAAAHAVFAVAAERAAASSPRGTASFAVGLVDELSRLDGAA